ncbi:hypothetical protein BU17DRAFT_70810 [Hysterangium stoloniferum]|nr:hypothetical protein BU17DRAFT_70810 [Hysterangium stoloniferum]
MALRGYVALLWVEKEARASDAARENMSFSWSMRANVSLSSSSNWIAAFGVIMGVSEHAVVIGVVDVVVVVVMVVMVVMGVWMEKKWERTLRVWPFLHAGRQLDEDEGTCTSVELMLVPDEDTWTNRTSVGKEILYLPVALFCMRAAQ